MRSAHEGSGRAGGGDVTVRRATRDDAPAIARVRIDTWRVAYDGLIDGAVLEGLDVRREAAARAARWDEHHVDPRAVNLVAERGGRVVGWAAAGPSDDPRLPGWGQVFALYALPDEWGGGIGHALMTAAEAHVREAGFAHALLWVLDGNERAAAFYERHGWREDGATLLDERIVGGTASGGLLERRRVKAL